MSARPAIDAPAAPVRGTRVFTLERQEYGPDADPVSSLWGLGVCRTVTQVNGRNFYFYTGGFPCPAKGATHRRLLVEWRQWLAELQCDHHVWLLVHDEDPAGWGLVRPLQPSPLAVRTERHGLDRFERDQRFLRAVQNVAERYRLERREDEDGGVVVTVQGGSKPYEVRVRLDWSEPPACTCPDAVHRRPLHGGFCKHVVAVLLRWPDLRCQLLGAIL